MRDKRQPAASECSSARLLTPCSMAVPISPVTVRAWSAPPTILPSRPLTEAFSVTGWRGCYRHHPHVSERYLYSAAGAFSGGAPRHGPPGTHQELRHCAQSGVLFWQPQPLRPQQHLCLEGTPSHGRIPSSLLRCLRQFCLTRVAQKRVFSAPQGRNKRVFHTCQGRKKRPAHALQGRCSRKGNIPEQIHHIFTHVQLFSQG